MFERGRDILEESSVMPQKRQTIKSKGIPDTILRGLEERLRRHSATHWPACRSITIRGRGEFAYVEVQGPDDLGPEPLCRLRYMGNPEEWEFAYFTWAREVYQPSFLGTGLPFGSPEDCFDAAAPAILS